MPYIPTEPQNGEIAGRAVLYRPTKCHPRPSAVFSRFNTPADNPVKACFIEKRDETLPAKRRLLHGVFAV